MKSASKNIINTSLLQALNRCQWRLLKVKTNSNEPKKLLPQALSKDFGPFKRLFRQKSILAHSVSQPLSHKKTLSHKEYSLFHSQEPFSQARLSLNISQVEYVYALCEFTSESLDSDQTKTNIITSEKQPALYLKSSHPVSIYLNGQKLQDAYSSKNQQFTVKLNDLSHHLKPDKSQQLLLRFHPYRSHIIWAFVANNSVQKEFWTPLNFYPRVRALIQQESEDKKTAHHGQNPHKAVGSQAKLTNDLKSLMHDLEAEESSTGKSMTSKSITSKKLSHISNDEAQWLWQAWSIQSTKKPLIPVKLRQASYDVVSMQRLYLPQALVTEKACPHKLESSLKLERLTEAGASHITRTDKYLTNQALLASVGIQDLLLKTECQKIESGFILSVTYSFHWLRPLWSLSWTFQDAQEPQDIQKNRTPRVIIADKYLDQDLQEKQDQWNVNYFSGKQHDQQIVWTYSSVETSLGQSKQEAPSVQWSAFKDDTELALMYQPILRILSEATGPQDIQTQRPSIESLSDLDDFLITQRKQYDHSLSNSLLNNPPNDGAIQPNHLLSIRTYFEERPGGLIWKDQAIPKHKQLLSEWQSWLKNYVQFRFIAYPNPVFNKHPLSAESQLLKRLSQYHTQTSGPAQNESTQAKAILWSPSKASKSKLRLPHRFWGIKLTERSKEKDQKASSKGSDKPLTNYLALNQLELPPSSEYLELDKPHTQTPSFEPTFKPTKRLSKSSLHLNLQVVVHTDQYNPSILWLTWIIDPMISFKDFRSLFNDSQNIGHLNPHLSMFQDKKWIRPAFADQVLSQALMSSNFRYIQSTWWPKKTWSSTQATQSQNEYIRQLMKDWRQGLKASTRKLRVVNQDEKIEVHQQISMHQNLLPLLDIFENLRPLSKKYKSVEINRTLIMDHSLYTQLCRSNERHKASLTTNQNQKLKPTLILNAGQQLLYQQKLFQTSPEQVRLKTRFYLNLERFKYDDSHISFGMKSKPKQDHLLTQLEMIKAAESTLCDPSLR